jgi:hypothetical protein
MQKALGAVPTVIGAEDKKYEILFCFRDILNDYVFF